MEKGSQLFQKIHTFTEARDSLLCFQVSVTVESI